MVSPTTPSPEQWPKLCDCSYQTNHFIKDSLCGLDPLMNAFLYVLSAICILTSGVGIWAIVKYCERPTTSSSRKCTIILFILF